MRYIRINHIGIGLFARSHRAYGMLYALARLDHSRTSIAMRFESIDNRFSNAEHTTQQETDYKVKKKMSYIVQKR